MFDREPFTRREAWLWLISEAAWKPRRKGKLELQRGQTVHSLRFMAKAWQWNKGQVRWFLQLLKNDTMISTVYSTVGIVITICKYDEYQLMPSESSTVYSTLNSTPTAPTRIQKIRTNKEARGRARDEETRAPLAEGASSETWEFGDQETVKVRRNDPRWPALCARYEQEKGRAIKFADKWPFPKTWVMPQ